MKVTKPIADLHKVNTNSWRNCREVMKIQWKYWENLKHLLQQKNVSEDRLHKEQVKWPKTLYLK